MAWAWGERWVGGVLRRDVLRFWVSGLVYAGREGRDWLLLPNVWPVIRAMVGKGKSIIVARRGKKPSLLAEGLVSDSSSSRPCGGGVLVDRRWRGQIVGMACVFSGSVAQ